MLKADKKFEMSEMARLSRFVAKKHTKTQPDLN